ncbi:MAG TPA: hypothetical protein DCP92_19015 [Nitrospiraceae bacterium]|nr:hypothetical protein [Nitrospiraceae bacterium]
MKNVCVLCNRELHGVHIKNITEGGEVYDIFFCEECNAGRTVPLPLSEALAFEDLYAMTRYWSQAGKRVWFHLDDVPSPLHLFSVEGPVALQRKDSFVVTKVRRFDAEYTPFGWVQTLPNVSGVQAIQENCLGSCLKSPALRKSERKSLSIRDALLTFILLPSFLLFSLFRSLYESFLKKGGTIEVYAIRA